MNVRKWVSGVCAIAALSAASLDAQSLPVATPAARTVVYHDRDVVAIQTRLRFTTLIVLPDGEDVVEATCGDKEFWIVNVRGGLVSVKPAKAGSATNLNLVTTQGRVYAFTLTEGSSTKGDAADLTVYLETDSLEAPHREDERPTYVRAEQLEDFRAQAELAREQAREAREKALADVDAGITAFRIAYPLTLQFPYRFVADTKPFWLQAMFHDDHRTFIQARPRELPALYEIKDGRSNLVSFDVQQGVYVVPKILDDGYFMIGTARLAFRRVDAKERH